MEMEIKKDVFLIYRGLYSMLEKLMFDPNVKSQIINIGPDEEFITINELYEIISNKLKFNHEAVYDNARPNEVYHAVCSSDKARKILSIKLMSN